MRRRIYIYVPGILSWPGDADGWTDKAVTWTHVCTPFRAEKFEYMAGIFTRRFKQQYRAEKLAKMLTFYHPQEWEVILVGHSNGCDVILRALKLSDRHIECVQFFAPAVDEDFKNNGILELLKEDRVGEWRFYIGGSDRAMKLAQISCVFGHLYGLGFGALGALDPGTLRSLLSGYRTPVIAEPEFDHSTWFEKQSQFDRTMRRIIAS